VKQFSEGSESSDREGGMSTPRTIAGKDTNKLRRKA